MTTAIIRILFLADTHLGFDYAFRPRIKRRRRGPEFFASFERALQPALEGRVDGVVHGGDLLFRSKVPARLVAMAFEPLRAVAARGIPVYLVPGNHERSAIPHGHLAEHPLIHIFNQPRSFLLQKAGFTLALSGFPFVRRDIRKGFKDILNRSGWRDVRATAHVLCIHQSIDGATVGPTGYMFRSASDVINPADIPAGIAAVLSGHIHRFQVLTQDLRGNALPAPIFYSGSTERTSFAEKNEKKGYLILEFGSEGSEMGLGKWEFADLPARPMIQLELNPSGKTGPEVACWVQTRIDSMPADSIVKLKVFGEASPDAMEVLRAASLRALAPPTMNIDARFIDQSGYRRR
jgi:DNA repair exonuclease SbcCD nuclease subunit